MTVETGTGPLPRPADQLPRLARDTTADNPWPVAVLSRKFHMAVEKWPAAWICGQITEINARRAGSVYLTLRDDAEDVAIYVSGWRGFAQKASSFRQGDRVVLHGKADLWVKATRLSFIGDDIRKIGAGGLKEQIDRLRRRLKGEGLFDQDRKVPLPAIPRCIGLICAPQARAEGDVKMNVNLRWPAVSFRTVHVHVQGEQCPREVAEAIARLDADPEVDVIVVARGGGAFEDLIGFSDEGVVRAAAACRTPLVSAIGHEDDWTLLDLVADLRASTPTDAAKRIVPDVHEELAMVDQARQRMRMRLSATLAAETRLVEGYANRPSLTHPRTMLDPHLRVIEDARRRLDIGMRRLADSESMTVEKARASLRALSPQSTLDRGYAVVQTSDGHVVDDASALSRGDLLTLTLRRGSLTAETRDVMAP